MSSDDSVLFMQRLELLLDYMHHKKPHCIIFTGDFNCRNQQWRPGNIENKEGAALDEFSESNNLTQLIDQSTHITNENRSCIDLIITDQPNFLVDYGVHPSLYKTCHHEITYGKINLSVPLPIKGKSGTIKMPTYPRFGITYRILTGMRNSKTLMLIL